MKIIMLLTLTLSGCAAFQPPSDMTYDQRLAVMQSMQHPAYQQQFYSMPQTHTVNLTCQHYNAQMDTCTGQ